MHSDGSEKTSGARASNINFFDYPILYVDDESVALELFRENFCDDFTIFIASSAYEAQVLLEHHDIGLILADQRMPGLSGTELFAEVQKTHPDIIRILVTAYADLDAVVSAINAGHVYHYVEKPWDHEELKLMIKRGLEHFHLVRERDRLQQERIRTLENMARGNRLAAVGTLAAGIAHEIRNPLSAIITFHQMLPEKIKEAQKNLRSFEEDFWTRFAQIPLKEVERIKRLVQELLDFSRTSSTAYRLQPVCLKTLIENLLPMIETDFKRAGIELRLDFPETTYEIEADADKIKQVVINLLLNALHACKAGDHINLKLSQDPESLESSGERFCELQVADTGAGIKPEDQERIFDPFFTTRDPGVGTGLGLTMCHHIVSNHHGEIRLESDPGEGTRIFVRFPVVQKTLEISGHLVPLSGAHGASSPDRNPSQPLS